MAKTCTLCCNWNPTQWDGAKGHWADTVAKCFHKNKFTTAGETCESYSLVNKKPIVSNHERIVRALPEVKPGEPEPLIFPPVETLELYGHQKEAFEQFKDTLEMGIFFTMGLGKSAVALRIASYKYKKGEINALLIIAPNTVHVQWYKEQIPLWLDCDYQSQCLFGRGGQKQAYPFDDDERLQVVTVNIDTFSTPTKWIDIVEWGNSRKLFIILDEASVIKNIAAKRTERLLYQFNEVVRRRKTIVSSKVKTVARAVLTGTPVTNGPMDLYCIFEFLRPNYFGRNWYSFRAHFGMFVTVDINDRPIQVPLTPEWWDAIKAINNYQEAHAVCGCSEDTFNTVHAQDHYEGPYKHADELKELIAPISIFKSFSDVFDMPEQVKIVRPLVMSENIAKCYNEMVEMLMAEYAGKVTTAKNKLTAIMRLQQITSGFIVQKNQSSIEENDDEDRVSALYGIDNDDLLPIEIQWIDNSNPKLERLYNDVAESEKPVIIITRFTAEADRIFNDLKKNYSCCLMTGWKRVGTVEEFKEGKYDVMVANSAVVARGFNLQNSHTILFYSNTFSLENRLQAEGRIFRIGQTNKCMYIDYQYTWDKGVSVDEKVVTALQLKRNLLDYITESESMEEVLR